MKKITEKGMTQKIIITILFVILFNFIFSNVSQVVATDDKKDGTDYGFGILFEPIKDLLLGVSDAVIWGIQYIILGQNQTFVDFQKLGHPDNHPNAAARVPVQTIKLPKFNISPEEMFSNNVPLLDVNFFNPAEPKAMNDEYETQENFESRTEIAETKYDVGKDKAIKQWITEKASTYTQKNLTYSKKNLTWTYKDKKAGKYHAQYYCKDENKAYQIDFDITETKDDWIGFVRKTTINGSVTIWSIDKIPTDLVDSSSMELQPIISKWYYALRNFAIIALLSILVYIAIRIIISSSMKDRAKYKTRLYDWLVAMCLIFFMHYIMSFAVTLTEEIIDVVNSANLKYECNVKFNEDDYASFALDGQPVNYDNIKWETNIMGKVRLEMQIMPEEYTDAQVLLHSFGYTVMYMGLIMYTVLFLFRYLKRLLILTFLTMIAPLMAMTYPLDKMHDGNAQGFMTWLKEYVYNLLIQPVHLILYTILIGASIELLDNNILYALVAFGFILQAEKIMMKFFGFNKASTVSTTSAALGGALAVKGISMLSQKLGSNSKKPNKEQKGENNKIKQANRKPDKDINQLMGSVFGNTGIGPRGGSNPQNPPATNENQNNGENGENQPPTYNGQGNGQDNGQDNGQGNGQGNGQNGSPNFTTNNPQPSSNTSNENNNQQEQGNNNSQQDADSQEEQERDALEELMRLSNRNNGSQASQASNKKKTLTKSQRFAKGARYVGPKLAKSLAKGLLKGTLKAGLVGTGATIGLTAGLVSDDFSNVFKYGAVGAGAGLIAGEGLYKRAVSLKNKISDEYSNLYEATHTKEELNAKLEEKALKSAKRIEKYREKFKITREEAERMLQEEVRKYREYGITDDDIIIKSMQAKEFGDTTTPEQRTSNERIILAKMAQQVDGKEDNYKRLKEGLEDRGVSSVAANKYLGAIRTFNNWV